MEDESQIPKVTEKPRKRKKEGRKTEKEKKIRLSSHITGPDCQCTRLKCFQVVNEENRARLIDKFNSLTTKDAQDAFLATMITVAEINRQRPRSQTPKSSNSFSYYYKVFVNGDDGADSFAYVCFKAFLSFFGIKKGRLETIKRSLATTGEPPQDERGKHTNRPRKLSEDLLQKIRDHISSFRGRQSHYSQEKTRRIYLPEDLNIHKMYDMFKTLHPQEKLSYESYRTVFNNDFNIGFGYPRTDTCSKCDEFKIQIDALKKLPQESPDSINEKLKEITTQRDIHQRKADTFYRRKRDAKQKAKTTENMEAFTFDFQKNLNVPNQSTNDFYYHRKLTFHSFNVHQLSTDDAFIYAYDETVAKNGSDDVASMLYHHFKNNVSANVRHLELFCDSCAGQNKNYTLIRFFDFLVHHEKRFDSIKVTFPERGHSYMECDRDMGLINTKASVSVPSDWVDVFKSARKEPTPYIVIEVTQKMMKDFSTFLRPFYKKRCPVPSRPIREMLFSEKAGMLSHRDSWNGLFLKTSFICPGKAKPVKGEPKPLYTAQLCISTAKYKDLQLLKKFSTDPAFFDSLPYADKSETPDELDEN